MNAVYLFFEWKLLLTTNFDFFSLRYHCHPELLSIISIPIVVVQLLSRIWLFATQHGLQHPRLPCPSLSFGVCSNSCPLSKWCYPTISYSVAPFSSCPQSFPASGSFPVSWLFASGGQSIRTSASASILLVNIQGWFPLGLTGLISLLSKGLRSFFQIALCPTLISILLGQNLTRFLKRKFGQVSIWSCFTYYL